MIQLRRSAIDPGVVHPSSFLSPRSPGLTALALKVDSASEAMGRAGLSFAPSLSLTVLPLGPSFTHPSRWQRQSGAHSLPRSGGGRQGGGRSSSMWSRRRREEREKVYRFIQDSPPPFLPPLRSAAGVTSSSIPLPTLKGKRQRIAEGGGRGGRRNEFFLPRVGKEGGREGGRPLAVQIRLLTD